jgi:2-polyprenyl-3-methyl-5-hydroxy-6-metoxy-1,4-benzoquinol methylase
MKVALDGVCGRECFASEIIWRYRRWPSKTRNFQRVHDVLLRYVKPGDEPTWTQLYEPLSPKTIETWGMAKQRAVWLPGENKAEKATSRRKSSSAMEEQSPGVPMGDVWEIGIIAPSSNERTGYPTQKPEALLERLVVSLTNPGDWVLDPTCGSGTTLAVCAVHGRHAVGIDSSAVAIRTAEKRLASFLNLAPTDLWPAALEAP